MAKLKWSIVLRSLVGEHIKDWDSKLPTAEFAYNNYVNHSIGLSPIEVVQDLIPMCPKYRIFKPASLFASHLHQLHKEIIHQIEQSNANYKLHADLKRIFKTFEVGDLVMVRIHSERFLK